MFDYLVTSIKKRSFIASDIAVPYKNMVDEDGFSLYTLLKLYIHDIDEQVLDILEPDYEWLKDWQTFSRYVQLIRDSEIESRNFEDYVHICPGLEMYLDCYIPYRSDTGKEKTTLRNFIKYNERKINIMRDFWTIDIPLTGEECSKNVIENVNENVPFSM